MPGLFNLEPGSPTNSTNPQNSFIRKPLFECLVTALALFFPYRLLWPPKANFYVDWYAHKWAIGYFGQYFRTHGFMPAVFNTPQWGGIAAPVFYGNLGYPILGVFSSILAPGTVLRLAVVFLFAAQYRWIVQALGRLESPRWLAHSVAALTIWATYPLTNLFNRGAFTEFIATGLLTCALSLAILMAYAPSKTWERRYANRMMLCLTIAAGTHPITAMFGIPFFGIIVVLLLRDGRNNPERIRARIRMLVPGVAGALACLAAWLYAVAKYTGHVTIRNIVPSVIFMQDGWDRWLTRFYPIPLDPRVQPGIPLYEIKTPYLDAQVNVPLLILFAALCIAVRSRRATAISISLFAFFTWLSLSPASYQHLPSIFRFIQFAFRAVTYQNLALLLGVFLLMMALQNSGRARSGEILKHRALHWIAAGCILLAVVGVMIKGTHVRAGRSNNGNGALFLPSENERQALIDLPVQYYQVSDYATPDLFVALTAEEFKDAVPMAFSFDSHGSFGDARPADLSLDRPSWVRTNIQAFPWNKFEIDHRDVPASDIRADDESGLAFRVPEGNHRLEYKFVPDRTWEILRTISLTSLFGWLLIEIVQSVRQARSKV